jgi:hypothetical protein
MKKKNLFTGGDGHVGVQRSEVEPGRQGDGPCCRICLDPCSIRCRIQTKMGPEATVVPITKKKLTFI